MFYFNISFFTFFSPVRAHEKSQCDSFSAENFEFLARVWKKYREIKNRNNARKSNQNEERGR